MGVAAPRLGASRTGRVCFAVILFSCGLLAGSLRLSQPEALQQSHAGKHARLCADVSASDVRATGGCFWQPDVPTDLELRAQLRQCVAGKKVVVYGNSVSRHWFFIMASLLSDARNVTRVPHDLSYGSYRQAQKSCGSGNTSGTTCTQGDVVFRWEQSVFEPSLRAFLASAKADVIIANAGLHYMIHEPSTYLGRTLNETRALGAFLASLPSSTRVYWRTTTKICPNKPPRFCAANNMARCGVPAEVNAMVQAANVFMPALLSQADPRVRLLDVDAMAPCEGYDDHVHHALLSVDHILAWFARECAWLQPAILSVCPHLCPHVSDLPLDVRS